MKNLLVVLVFLLLAASLADAQTNASLSGRYNVLDTTGGSPHGVWKRTFDFSTSQADSSFTSQTLATTGVSLAIGANETWWYDYYAVDSSSTALGGKIGFDIPSGAAIAGVEKGSKSAQDTIGAGIISADATAGEAFTLYVPTSNYGIYEAHFIVVNGVTAGNVIAEALKATSGTFIIRKYATLTGHRIN